MTSLELSGPVTEQLRPRVDRLAREARATTGDLTGATAPDGSWASFSDPDGNGWLLQEITQRLPGRE